MRETLTDVRVRYPEVDRMGFAHHTAYPVWFEIGRTELMRAAGIPYGRLEDEHGLLFPVIALSVRYVAPAHYDERLAIRTTLAELGGVRVRFLYRIAQPQTERVLAEGETTHAACGRDGRPRRIPGPVRTALLLWQSQEDR